LDGDGDTDIALTNLEIGSNDVSLFWNDGDGNFSGPNHISFGNKPTVIKVSKLDEDNDTDLIAIANDTLTVRWNNSGGNFSQEDKLEFIKPVEDFIFVDLNEDGKTDIFQTHLGIVGVEQGDVSQFINLGNRNFLFANMGPYYAGQNPSSAAAGELNNDQYTDVVVIDYVNGNVAVLINLGATGGIWDGFEQGVQYPVFGGSSPLHANLEAADIDGDFDVDILVGGEWGIGIDSLFILRNNGDGSYAPVEKLPLDGFNRSETFTLLDYENDGDADIVTANVTHNLSLFLNDGFGNFDKYLLCQNSELGGEPLTVLSAKLDNNNSDDIAVLTITDDVVIFLNQDWIPTGIKNDVPISKNPQTLQLSQNYPNPFNPTTNIKYSLPKSANVSLRLFDILGREVANLVNDFQQAGQHEILFDAQNLASGMYFYRIKAGDYVETKKMMLMR
jgi:hypothetical protein